MMRIILVAWRLASASNQCIVDKSPSPERAEGTIKGSDIMSVLTNKQTVSERQYVNKARESYTEF